MGHLAELIQLAYFQQVQLGAYGTLTGPNAVDFCPDVLCARSTPLKG